MAFSRQRLALMGIDLWVAHRAATQHSDEMLWRDVTSAATPLNQISFNEVHSQVLIQTLPTCKAPLPDIAQDDFAVDDSDVNSSAVLQLPTPAHVHSHQQPSEIQHVHKSEQLYSEQHPSEQDVQAATRDITLLGHITSESLLANLPDVPPTQTLYSHRLQLEACIYEQVILLVNASDLDAEAKLLWHNIQRGLNAQFAQLVWPSAFTEWQELRGLASYISGFLAAYAAQKTILVLGECSALNGLCVSHTMPSLNAMLLNPLLKQQLWHSIRECNNLLPPV